MMVAEAALLMSMSDIAALARVRRPVVSVWRTRAATTPPFPSPTPDRERGQEYFDAGQVGAWLAATQRGNNPDAAADAAAHAAPHALDQAEDDTLPVVTALLTLRSLIGLPLNRLSPDDLLDAADEQDPDDEMLYREVEQAGEILPQTGRYRGLAVEAGFGEAAVFESLVTQRSRLGRREIGGTALSAPGLDLMCRTASALAATSLEIRSSLTCWEAAPTPWSRSRTTRISWTRPSSPQAMTASPRACYDAGWPFIASGTRKSACRTRARSALAGSIVHVIQLPAPGDAGMTAAGMLSTLDRIILQLDASQLAVIPALGGAERCEP